MMEALGERAKAWEQAAETKLDADRPILCRLDGRSFSDWTRCCEGAWDLRLHGVFVAVLRVLARETGAVFAATHSDELSLVLAPSSQVLFGGRVQKMATSLASLCTLAFAQELRRTSLDPHRPAAFDARVWNVPGRAEALESIAWRETDASINAVSTRALEFFRQSEIEGLSTQALKRRLEEAGHPVSELPEARRYGVRLARRVAPHRFTSEEVEALPPKHAARFDPALVVSRPGYVEVPPLCRLDNGEAVMFDGAEPIERPRAVAA